MDLLKPDDELKNISSSKKVIEKKQQLQIKNYRGKRNRIFNVDDAVAVRDYRFQKPAWIKGKICKVIGPRTYIVYIPELEKQWRRHLNQMIDFADFSLPSTSVVNNSAESVDIFDTDAQLRTDNSQIVMDGDCSDSSIENCVVLPRSEESPPKIRCSTRKIVKPVRYGHQN